MAGVNAHPYPAFVINPVYYMPQVFKPVAQVCALSGSILDDGNHPGCFFKRYVYRLGYEIQALFLGDFSKVASGMEIQPVKSEQLAPFHLIIEGMP